MDLNLIAKEIRVILQDYRNKYQITFDEDSHTYTMLDNNDVLRNDYESVSKVITYFHDEFDAKTKSLQMCGGNIEKQQELLLEWKQKGDYATNMGSRVHYELERYLVGLYGDFKSVRHPIFECDEVQVSTGDQMILGGQKFIKTMHERNAVLLDTEIVLGSPDCGYVGQPDKVWLYENKGELSFIVTDWKGLPIDTPILTDKGWKIMNTLTLDDKVFDKNGKLVKINHISSIKHKKCLKMKFNNNDEIISDFEHRWLVYIISNYKKTEKVMTTQEIKDYYDKLPIKKSNTILKIQNAKPLDLEYVDLPIDPYVFGMWFGDGHKSCGMVTQANSKVWDEITKRGYTLGNDVSGGTSGKAQSRTIIGLRTELRKLNVLFNKHLPEIFLLCSYEQRLDLLRGLMDADGYYNKKRNRFSISTTKQYQIDFSVEILSSLGIKTSVLKYFKYLNGKKIQCYNIEFSTTIFNPFLCRNQDINVDIKKDKNTYRNILSVEEVESVPTKCIEVESDSHTYLCGKNLLVTHNTNKEKNFMVQSYTGKMYEPVNQLFNNSLGHYQVQLPCYAKLLIDMLRGSKYENIKLIGCIIVLLKKEGTFEEYRVPKKVYNTILEMDINDYMNKKRELI